MSGPPLPPPHGFPGGPPFPPRPPMAPGYGGPPMGPPGGMWGPPPPGAYGPPPPHMPPPTQPAPHWGPYDGVPPNGAENAHGEGDNGNGEVHQQQHEQDEEGGDEQGDEQSDGQAKDGNSEAGSAQEAPKVEEVIELLPENNTVYVQNLDEKVKEKELKKALRAIFEQFGEIIQIVAMSSFRRKGQAWVVFSKLDSAREAVKKMQRFPLLGKPMRLNFARVQSDITAKRAGCYVPRVKQPLGPKPPTGNETKSEGEGEGEDEGNPERKRANGDGEGASGALEPAAPTPVPYQKGPRPPPIHAQVPNKILFVERLPEDTTEAMVQTIFEQFSGFKEVRLIPQRPGIAFVEYETEYHAGLALTQLQGFRIRANNEIYVSYAKK